MRPRDPFQLWLVLLVYVLPLSVAIVLLAISGLPQLALILLGVEAVVAAAVFLAQRPRGGEREIGSDEPPQKGVAPAA